MTRRHPRRANQGAPLNPRCAQPQDQLTSRKMDAKHARPKKVAEHFEDTALNQEEHGIHPNPKSIPRSLPTTNKSFEKRNHKVKRRMKRSRRSPSPWRRSRSRSRDRRSRSSRGSARRSRTRERSEYRSMTRSRSREKYNRSSRSRVSVSPSNSSSRSPSPRPGRDKKPNPSSWLESAGYGRMTPPPAPSLSSDAPPAPSISSKPPPAPAVSSELPPAPAVRSEPPPAMSSVPPPVNPGPPPASFESQPIPTLGGQANPSHRQNFGKNFQGNYANFNNSTFYPDEEQPFGYGNPNNFKPQVPPGFGGPLPMPVNSGPPASDWIQLPPNYQTPNFQPPATGNPQPAQFNNPPQHPPVPAEAGKQDAIEQELIQQKKTFASQREEFFTRKIALTRELASLREQKAVLQKTDTKGAEKMMQENSKLQDEILQKLKSMDNVIEMLTHMIGDKDQIADLLRKTSYSAETPKIPENRPKKEKRKRSRSRSRSRSKTPKKEKKKKKEKKPEKKRSRSPQVAKVNVVHYDPELHWCSACNVFPRSAVTYLAHLHSDQHKKVISEKKDKDKTEEEFMPWRVHQPREPSPPVYKDAPSRRVPIRGVPFLSAASAWYCSLCKMWLGDMDVVSTHLRGKIHADSYTEYVTQNPHWEVDWLRDRTRAYERNSEALTAQKEEANSKAKKGEKAQSDAATKSANVGHLETRLRELIAATKAVKNKEKRRRSSSSSSDNSSSSNSGSDQSSDERGQNSKRQEKDNKTNKGTSDKKKFEKKKDEKNSKTDKDEKKSKTDKDEKKSKTDKKETSRKEVEAHSTGRWGKSESRSRSRSRSMDRDDTRRGGFRGEHDWERVKGFGYRGNRGRGRGRGGRAVVVFGNRPGLARRLGPPAKGFYGPAEPPKKK